MKFKNLKTGLVWDITEDAHIKRLSGNADFEIVEDNPVVIDAESEPEVSEDPISVVTEKKPRYKAPPKPKPGRPKGKVTK